MNHLAFSNTSARQRFASFQPAHFTFNQSRVGPEMYGLSSRVDTIPSSRSSGRITLPSRVVRQDA
jgi:hypothetical protein